MDSAAKSMSKLETLHNRILEWDEIFVLVLDFSEEMLFVKRETPPQVSFVIDIPDRPKRSLNCVACTLIQECTSMHPQQNVSLSYGG